MSNLSAFKSDNGIEIIINQQTGESFCSVSGYARMSGKDKGTISRRLKAVASNEAKTDEILTPGGIQGVVLVNEDLITDWIVDDNPMMAKQLLKAGVRVFLHKLAGYKVTSEAVQPQPKSLAETIVMIGHQMLEQERRQAEIESKQHQLECRTEVVEEKVAALNGASNYSTVRAYCRVKRIRIGEAMARRVGTVAGKICRAKGYPMGQVPDERHGTVNSYPDDVLAEAIASVLKAS
jgi:hypothetical protein